MDLQRITTRVCGSSQTQFSVFQLIYQGFLAHNFIVSSPLFPAIMEKIKKIKYKSD